MKAVREIGWQKVLRFFLWTLFESLFSLAIFPPLRVWLLKIFGAEIGKNVVIDKISLANLYGNGLKKLKIGDGCFLGKEVFLDLAGPVTLEDNVTLAFRVMLVTHLNVGYQAHHLHKAFPRMEKSIKIRSHCFVGAGALILPGVTIGKESFVAAGSLVNKDVGEKLLVAGNPAKVLRKLVG